VIGNEFVDAIAKHAALHNYGHDEAFPPQSPDGNPFAHINWLAEENNETSHTTTNISLAPPQNNKDILKAHMSKHHRLGDANTNSGYYNYWKRLLTIVNLTTSNSFWSNTRMNVLQKRNVMKLRMGTLTLRKWPTSTAEPLIHLVCLVICQTAKSICFLAVRMLQFKTW